jgi:hypothetical protein
MSTCLFCKPDDCLVFTAPSPSLSEVWTPLAQCLNANLIQWLAWCCDTYVSSCPLCGRHLRPVLEYPLVGSVDVSRTPDLLPTSDQFSSIKTCILCLLIRRSKKILPHVLLFCTSIIWVELYCILIMLTWRHLSGCCMPWCRDLRKFSLHLMQLLILNN